VNENFLKHLGERCYEKVFGTFTSAYVAEARKTSLIPVSDRHVRDLIDLYIFEKAVREIGNFIENEPRSLIIPVKALRRIKDRIEQQKA
jgi:predicted trehalose synthase